MNKIGGGLCRPLRCVAETVGNLPTCTHRTAHRSMVVVGSGLGNFPLRFHNEEKTPQKTKGGDRLLCCCWKKKKKTRSNFLKKKKKEGGPRGGFPGLI